MLKYLKKTFNTPCIKIQPRQLKHTVAIYLNDLADHEGKEVINLLIVRSINQSISIFQSINLSIIDQSINKIKQSIKQIKQSIDQSIDYLIDQLIDNFQGPSTALEMGDLQFEVNVKKELVKKFIGFTNIQQLIKKLIKNIFYSVNLQENLCIHYH